MLKQSHVVVRNVRIAYLEREADGGSDDKTPILLLHGLLATAETLAELILKLPRDRRIVALDMLSARTITAGERLDVHFNEIAELVREFVETVGLRASVVIGHSHGGVIALRLAATERDLMKSMVLLCPAHPFGGYRSHVVNFYLTRVGRVLALCIPLAPRWMILRAYNEAAGPESRIRVRHLQPYMRVLRNRNTLRRVLQMLQTWDDDMAELQRAMEALPIATPTLLIWGDADPVVPVTSAAELARHMEDGELTILPKMGHLLAEEAPAECAALIEDWLIRRKL